MKFNKGSSVEALSFDAPISQLITPGHAIHARMLASVEAGKMYGLRYKFWKASTAVAMATIIFGAGVFYLYTTSKLSIKSTSAANFEGIDVGGIQEREISTISATLIQNSHATTDYFVADASSRGLNLRDTINLSSTPAQLISYTKEAIAALNAGKTIPSCIKSNDLTSKPWHNNFNFEGPLCSAVFTSPLPHQWVWSVSHVNFDTKPWMGLFYKDAGTWSYKEVNFDEQDPSVKTALTMTSTYQSLLADFPSDARFKLISKLTKDAADNLDKQQKGALND